MARLFAQAGANELLDGLMRFLPRETVEEIEAGGGAAAALPHWVIGKVLLDTLVQRRSEGAAESSGMEIKIARSLHLDILSIHPSLHLPIQHIMLLAIHRAPRLPRVTWQIS